MLGFASSPQPSALWRDRRREEWVYDFGDNRVAHIVVLSDGRVSGVDAVSR
ncbi:DUF2845 domain-containing protein [Dokdonella soli]|uniref:DUF2845 domain-containing protein n=1 Tax=Dokdonella soli TaxID=529810 RepID=UPI0031D4F0D3